MVRYEIIFDSGLPVDRFKTLVEFFGAAELPFTEDCPNDCNSTDGCRDDYEHGHKSRLSRRAKTATVGSRICLD